MDKMLNVNVTLIGMPSSGKSSVGVILAKIMAYDFVDTDILVQNSTGMGLQDIVNRHGYLKLREIEADIVKSLRVENTVIATGGSVVYSEDAMVYLKSMSKVVYLKISFEEMVKRIGDFKNRGLAKPPDQMLKDMYEERSVLYEKYADITFVNEGVTAHDAAVSVKGMLNVV